MKKVAIVARAPSSRYLAPFDDQDVEIWTLSPGTKEEGFTDLPRWDRWYEVHDLEWCEQKSPGYSQWLSEQDQGKVYRADRLPLTEMGRDYFTSTIAYMIAHAVAEGVGWLGVYGVDMAHATEYAYQRPCVEYWIGYAEGKGVEVVIPPECDLSKHRRRYAIDDDPGFLLKLTARENELDAKLNECRAEIDKNLSVTAATVGAMSEVEQIRGRLNGEANASFCQWLEDRQKGYKQVIQDNAAAKHALQTEHDMLLGCLEELRYQKQWV